MPVRRALRWPSVRPSRVLVPAMRIAALLAAVAGATVACATAPSATAGAPAGRLLAQPAASGTSELVAQPAASATAELAAPSMRLGDLVIPKRQEVTLELDPSKPDYSGSTRILLDVRQAVTSFRFHAQDMELKWGWIDTAAGPLALAFARGEDGEVTATAPSPFGPGTYTLHVAFANAFGTRGVGLYRVEAGGDSYAFTQFEAVDARRAFPCFDEPGFKIPFRLNLTVPASNLAFSNTMPEREMVSDGKHTYNFRETPPLPSYLVAIAVGPFETVDVPGMKVPSRVVVPRGQAGLAGEAAAVTGPLVAELERWFGRPYPYEKLDLVAVPEYWYGAMENAGLITFKDDILLLDPRETGPRERADLASVVAHEVAHHWFGDLVTMAWWDDLWLNEAFAYWMDQWVPGRVFPEMARPAEGVRQVQRAMAADALPTAHAVRMRVDSLPNIAQASDTLTNDKGAAVLGMVDAWLGADTFRDGVRAYIDAHAWGNAVGQDLWNALTKVSGQDVGRVMSSFFDQPGVPLVEAEPIPGGVRLRQQRFAVGAAARTKKGARPQSWVIPVTLRYPASGRLETTTVLLDAPEKEFQLKLEGTPAWVHPNAGEVGYYRWTVPPATLRALTADAAATLSPRERVALVGHLEALVEAGRLAAPVEMETLARLAADPDPDVVAAAVGRVAGLARVFWSPELAPALDAWIRTALAPARARFGTAPAAGESLAASDLRPELLAVLGRAGDAEVRAWAAAYAERTLADPSQVDVALAGPALAISAIDGDAALFEAYQARFEKAATPQQRALFLDALGAFRSPALVERALAYVGSGTLRPQELSVIPRALGESWPPNQDVVFDWMTATYDAIAQRIPAEFLAFAPYYAYGCSQPRLDKARRFFADPKHSPPGTEIELAKVTASVESCLALRDREEAGVRAFLAAAAPATASASAR